MAAAGGIIFRLSSGAQVRPAGAQCIPPNMSIDTLRGFEAWEILAGKDWKPWEVNIAWIRFISPKNETMDDVMMIGQFQQLEVPIIVSETVKEEWTEKPIIVNLDEVPTPTSSLSSE